MENGGEVLITSGKEGLAGILFRNQWGDVTFQAVSNKLVTIVSTQKSRLHEKDGELLPLPITTPQRSGFTIITSEEMTDAILAGASGDQAIRMHTYQRKSGTENQVVIYDRAGKPYVWSTP